MNKFDKHAVLRRPFASIPNPEFLYRVGSMERALQETSRCIERVEGVACIIGNSGLGKSMACQALFDHFHELMKVVHLNSARLCTRRALLQNILFELGLPYRGMEEGELRLSLAEFLRTEALCPDGVLLLVDEAHTLPSRLLEEIRLLTNQVVGERVGIRLVLAGTSRLEERLATSPFESLNQRIVTRCYLEPLTAEETRSYIRHQLDVVQSRAFPTFQNEALQSVYTATGGVPRLINQLCDHVLVLADANGLESINTLVVEEAWADLQQLPAPWHMDTPPAKSDAQTSTVIEFGELDETADASLAMIASESDEEVSEEIDEEHKTHANEYSSRINPLLESDDNDLLDEHFAPIACHPSIKEQVEAHPPIVPFIDPNTTDLGNTKLDDSTIEYTLQHSDREDTLIHNIGEPPITDSTGEAFDPHRMVDLHDHSSAEESIETLPPLPERTSYSFEDVDLDNSNAQLTTDASTEVDSDVAYPDLLAPMDDLDTELELPEVEEDAAFEFAQGIEVDLPLIPPQVRDFHEVDAGTDAELVLEPEFDRSAFDPVSSSHRPGPDSAESASSNSDVYDIPAAANPFDEAFEEELEIEPLYSSTLDQNRSSLPSSWTIAANASFDEAVKALEPVSNDPEEVFPLTVNVQKTSTEHQGADERQQQAFNPFAADRTPAEDEPTVSELTPLPDQKTFDPWRYPALSDSIFEATISPSNPTDARNSTAAGLTVHCDEPLDEQTNFQNESEETDAGSHSELAASLPSELDIHSTLDESRYSELSESVQFDDDDLDERILREIVSFRDVTSFDPALDPVMPEFRPNTDVQPKQVTSDAGSVPTSHASTSQDGDSSDYVIPEIVLVDPVVPNEPSGSEQEDEPPQTGHHPESEDSKPAGKAHREDYQSLFDRLKGQ